jgi:hypothetical protein
MPDPTMTPEEFLREVAEIAVMSPDKPERIVSALRNYREEDDRFQEWAQGYLESAQWGGHNRADAIKQTLLARDEEVKRLRAALKDLVEDLEARWDMRDPRTNPGIRHYVQRAKDALAGQEVTHG